MIVRKVTIPLNASLSEKFCIRNHAIVGIETPAALTALTAALNVLACCDEDGTPVAATTLSGTQIAYTVNPAASTYVSTVGGDMVSAPLLQFQSVDASGTAKVQTAAVTFNVVLRRLFN